MNLECQVNLSGGAILERVEGVPRSGSFVAGGGLYTIKRGFVYR